MADLVMPRLSDTMEEGTILRWLKSDGDEVRRGEELVEIETDKATMTYESDLDGVAGDRRRARATRCPSGELIARIGEARRRTRAERRRRRAAGDGRATRPAQPAERGVAPAAGAAAPRRPARTGGRRGAGERVKASPLARRIARESGVDLRALTGSGPGGRIVKADVRGAGAGARGATQTRRPAAAQRRAAAGARGARSTGRRRRPRARRPIVELSRTQQTIARRMAESKATIPDFTLQADVDMEECVGCARELKRLASRGRPGAPPDVQRHGRQGVRAGAARAPARQRQLPRRRACELHSRVNVGRRRRRRRTRWSCRPCSTPTRSRSARSPARRARWPSACATGTITPPELGRRHVHGLEPRDVRGRAASPRSSTRRRRRSCPSGRVEPRAVVRDGELAARHTMTLTLACDHRILYGADAAQFLARIRELLEAPAALTL